MVGGVQPDGGGSEHGSRRSNAVQLLIGHGADAVQHLNGNLFDHLTRTERLLVDWKTSEAVALAGLCHATYGTDGFATALITLDQRPLLAAAVDADVEATVYLYASCDRGFLYPQIGSAGPTTFRDRFSDAVFTPSEEQLRTFVDLTLANEADVAMSGNVPDADVRWFASLVERFGPLASPLVADACRRLVAPAG